MMRRKIWKKERFANGDKTKFIFKNFTPNIIPMFRFSNKVKSKQREETG